MFAQNETFLRSEFLGILNLKYMKHLENANFADDPQNEDLRSNYYEIVADYTIELRGIFKTISEIETKIKMEFDVYDIIFSGANSNLTVIVTILEEIEESDNFEDDYNDIKSKFETELINILDDFLN